jgi:hypothetical protein
MKHVGYMTLSFEGDVSFYHQHPVAPRGTMEPVWKLYSEVEVVALEKQVKMYKDALQLISEGNAARAIAFIALEKHL